MKKTLQILGIFLSMMPFITEAQTCNWKATNPNLTVWDSCHYGTNTNQIMAAISFNGMYSGKYPCEWKVNGVTTGSSSPVVQHNVTSNGTYTVCVKVRDNVNNCDTTFCTTVVVDCIGCVNWKSKISLFYVKDTCDQYPGKIYDRIDGINGWYTMANNADYSYYKYKWTLNSVPFVGNKGFLKILPNGNYTVCLTIRDTIKNCDTTLCRNLTVNCSPCANWKNRIQSFRIFDTCSQFDKMINGEVKLQHSYFVTYKWSVLNHGSGMWTDNASKYTFYPGSNGSYTVCLKMTDNAKNCDTTICRTINFQCLPACKWKQQDIRLDVWDSCKSYGHDNNSINCAVYTNNSFTSQYQYEWKVNGTTIQNTSGVLNYKVNTNDTFYVCVIVSDTVNKCDTTICRTFIYDCISNCNWKALNPFLYTYDSCNRNNNSNMIMAAISFNGMYSGKYPCEWSVNGNKIQGSGPTLWYFVSSNGNYDICVKARDTVNNCDTTFCKTVTVDCMPCGNWKSKIKTYFAEDTCNQFFNGIVGRISFNNNVPRSQFKFKWYINNAYVNNGGSLTEYLSANGNYAVCLNIRDTVNNCDTTICKTVYVNCYTYGLGNIIGNNLNLEIYPNPADNSIAFEWKYEGNQFEVTDALGRAIISGTTLEGSNTILTERLPNGIYWIRVFSSEGIYNSRVVISR